MGESQRGRQQHIRERVAAEGFVRTGALADEHRVSVMTVHRDLDALQSQGWLRKVRGGASALHSTEFHGLVGERMSVMTDVKRRLAGAAAEMVGPRQAIMIDDSTTCLHLARALPERGPLTVMTNSLPVITNLAGEPGIDLVALGGSYFPAYGAFLGLHTAEATRSFRADTLFMSTTAISRGRCYHLSQETVQVKRALIEAAARRVLLVDHTKLRAEGLYALAPLSTFDQVLVDDGVATGELRALRDTGVKVQLVRAR